MTLTEPQDPIRFERATQGRHPLGHRLDNGLEGHPERLLESELSRVAAAPEGNNRHSRWLRALTQIEAEAARETAGMQRITR